MAVATVAPINKSAVVETFKPLARPLPPVIGAAVAVGTLTLMGIGLYIALRPLVRGQNGRQRR